MRATRQYTKEEVLSALDPLVSEWFESHFKDLTPPQRYAVIPIHEGKNVLVSSPTGSGKTLTVFIGIISELLSMARKGELDDCVYAIYVSPLRALDNDIYRNLKVPLEEIRELAKKKGLELPEIRHAVRTGDTSTSERQKMLRKPPHILITTPETLAITLVAPKFREKFRNLRWVIVDEIHSLVESKRGVHLSLSLERLEHLVGRPFVRIGLSATINPLEEVAKFLVGYKDGKPRDCLIVDTTYAKKMDLHVMSPVPDLIYTPFNVINEEMYKYLCDLIRKHRTTLIFTNTRSGAERVAFRLRQLLPLYVEEIEKEDVAAHHGSLSRDVRFSVENRLKKGELKAVICVTPDSKVLSNALWVEISKIDGEKEIIYLNNELKLRKGGFRGVFHDIYRGRGFKIKSSLGFEIKCTKEHKFLTINDSSLKWVEAKDLRVGDRVAVIRKIPSSNPRIPKYHEFIPENAFVSFKKGTLEEIKKEIKYKFGTIKNLCNALGLSYSKVRVALRGEAPFVFGDLQKILNALEMDEFIEKAEVIGMEKEKNYLTSTKVSKEFIRFLGFYLAEGSWDTSGISIAGERDLLEYYSKLLAKDFQINPTKTRNPNGKSVYKFSSLLLRSIIERLTGGLRRESVVVEFPNIIYELPDEYKLEFLSGYFDGNGFAEIRKGKVYLGFITFNENFANGIQTLLLHFGIVAPKRSKKYHERQRFRDREIKKEGTCYTISIYGGEYVRRFAKLIRPRRKKLKLAVESVLRTKGHCSKDVIPNINGLLREIGKSISISTYSLQKLGYNPKKVEIGDRKITRRNLQRLIDIYREFKANTKYLEILAESDVFWDEIVEIEPIFIEEIYSLVDTPCHNYVIEGFICQNSSTSLELGIDIGYIDLVVQLGSPKSVTRAIQRVGRAGHRLGEVSKGVFICSDRDDAVEVAIMLKEAMSGHLDRAHMPRNALDVLAQHIAGMAIEQKWNVEEAYELVRRAYPYKDLDMKDFERVLRYLSGAYSQMEMYKVYGKIWYDPEEGVFGRRGKLARAIYSQNVGTIPDEVRIRVRTLSGKKLGSIEEEFLERLMPGDRFVLGGKVYEFVKTVRGFTAVVMPAYDEKPTVPSWFSEMLPLSYDLALEISRFRGKMFEWLEKGVRGHKIVDWIMKKCRADRNIASAILQYFREEWLYLKSRGVRKFPSDRVLLVEVFVDDDGKKYVVYHALFGRRVNDALSRAVAYLAGRRVKRNLGIIVGDHGFAIVYPPGVQVRHSYLMDIKPEELPTILKKAVERTELFERRFRHVATRGLMLLRRYKGIETSIRRRQFNAKKILGVVRELREFPLVKETYREILEDFMDVRNAMEVLRKIRKGKIQVVMLKPTRVPSPFSHNIVLQGMSDIVLMESRRQMLARLHNMVMKMIERGPHVI